MYRLFGREPALWLGLVQALVLAASTFGLDLTVDQQGAVNAAAAAIFGLLTAWSVAKDGLSAAILGFFKAGLSLAISFGLEMTPEQQMIIMGLVTAATAMFVRTQVTAPVQPTTNDPLS